MKVQYKNRMNKINKIDEIGVKNIMQNNEGNNVKEIVNDDLDKQRDEFKKKLMEKRRKTKLDAEDNSTNPSNSVNFLLLIN